MAFFDDDNHDDYFGGMDAHDHDNHNAGMDEHGDHHHDPGLDNNETHGPHIEIRDDTIHFPDHPLEESNHIGHPGQYVWYPATFDPNSGHQGIIGDPANDMDTWHMQTHDDTCAVVSQEFILEQLTGQHINEDQLREVAMENGWYTPGGGTPMADVGNLLEYFGLHVDKHEDSSISEIENALSHGEKVIVGVNSEEIWDPQSHNLIDEFLYNVMGIPGADANHAVEVIGVDKSDPAHPMVVLNDSGHPGGEGKMLPLHDFEEAWSGSNNYIVTASN